MSPDINPWGAGSAIHLSALEPLRAERLAQRTGMRWSRVSARVPGANACGAESRGQCFGLISSGQGLLQDPQVPCPQSHLPAT